MVDMLTDYKEVLFMQDFTSMGREEG